MKPFYACCILLAAGFTVDGVPSQSIGGGGFQTFATGESFFGTNGQGVAAYNGAAISVTQYNGKTEVRINNKLVDLDQATVMEENNQYKVLEPAGFPGARITINKANGQLSVDYGGAHYQTMTPEMTSAQLSQAMQGMEEELNHMRENLNKIFQGFPFRRTFPGF